ncbi:hypothetical protein D3C81_1712870 [compost metagenome]
MIEKPAQQRQGFVLSSECIQGDGAQHACLCLPLSALVSVGNQLGAIDQLQCLFGFLSGQ